MPVDRPQPTLGRPIIFAALAVAGTLLAMIAVYAGTGLHDGFGDWGLHRIGRRFRHALPWALPLAAVAGVFLHAYYARMLRPGVSGVMMLCTVVRAFVHFPLYGMLALFAMLWAFVHAIVTGVSGRWLRGGGAVEDSASPFARWLGPPVWFIILPFIGMKVPMEGDMAVPETISRRRLLRWLPAVIALILLYTDAVSEETGERIDPYWLAAIASFWLADYLMVALRVAPVLRARRRPSLP
jgi:hypothetical protein